MRQVQGVNRLQVMAFLREVLNEARADVVVAFLHEEVMKRLPTLAAPASPVIKWALNRLIPDGLLEALDKLMIRFGF